MELAVSKYAVVSLQRGKKVRWEEIELSNGEETDEANIGSCKCLGVGTGPNNVWRSEEEGDRSMQEQDCATK